MLKHLRSLSKDSLIYGLGNASASVLSFLLLPMYTRLLTPQDYGYLSLLTVYQSIAEITISFSLSSALFRYYLMAEKDQDSVLSTCLIIQFALILAISIPLFLASRSLSITLFQTTDFSGNLVLVTATALLGSLTTMLFSLMRAKRKTTLFAFLQAFRTLAMAGLNLLLVVHYRMNFQGVLITNLSVAAASLLLMAPFFAKDFLAPPSLGLAKKILAFSWPIYFVNLFAFFLNMSDRFFLNHYFDPADVGLYSFGNKIGSIVSIGIITPFSTAVLPYAFSIAKRDDFKSVFARIVKYFVLATFLASLPIFLFSKEFVSILGGSNYDSSWVVIGPTLLAGIFFGLYYVISIQLDISEKTYLATAVVFAGGMVSILSNYILVPRLGLFGSAISSCISNLVLFACMLSFGQRAFRVEHELKPFLSMCALTIAYGVGLWSIEASSCHALPKLLIKACLFLIAPAALWATGFFDSREIAYMRAFIGKRFARKPVPKIE